MVNITFRDANRMTSIEDWWYWCSISEKDRLRIERERGIGWDDMSDVLKKMIRREEDELYKKLGKYRENQSG
jgi:hypothetical protein